MPFHLILAAYNSAGERVRVIFSGSTDRRPSALGLEGRAVATGGEALRLGLPGFFVDAASGALSSSSPEWDLRNDNGQPLGGGIYVIQAELRDPYGQVSTLSESVQLITSAAESSLILFNSAGEMVRRLLLPGQWPPLVDILTASPGFAPRFDGQGINQAGDWIIRARDKDGVEHSLAWDGKNDHGLPVSSGVYTLQLTYRGGGAPLVITRSVNLIKAGEDAGLSDAVLGPNPLLPGADKIQIRYRPNPGTTVQARVFNLAGELVAQGRDASGQGRLVLDMKGLAGGVHLVRVEMIQGRAVRAGRVLKLAILR